jgi:hypothetical protein
MGVIFYIMIIIIFVIIAKTYSVHNTEDFMTYLVLPSSVVHQSKCFPTTLLYIAMSPASPCRFKFLKKKNLNRFDNKRFCRECRRNVIRDGFVTITKGESIRSFFEHAEEAEEEDVRHLPLWLHTSLTKIGIIRAFFLGILF